MDTVLKMFRENATENFVTHRDLQAMQVQTQFSGPSTITEHSCSSTDPKIAPPERFTGKREDCNVPTTSHLGSVATIMGPLPFLFIRQNFE